MKKNWILALCTGIAIAAPAISLAQQPLPPAPPVDATRPADALLPTPHEASPRLEAAGDLFTFRTPEPASPSDSLNAPTAAPPATWAFTTPAQGAWVAQSPAPRDGFEERIARLEAQVAELSRQLKSAPPAVAPPATARLATRTATPPTITWQPAITTNRVATPARIYAYQTGPGAPAATTTVAPGAPIVIHVYIQPVPGAATTAAPATYYYWVAPSTATTVPAVPASAIPPAARIPASQNAVPAPPAFPTPPAVTVPAVTAPPALPAAPAVPPAAPSSSESAPASAARIAWDDVPGETSAP